MGRRHRSPEPTLAGRPGDNNPAFGDTWQTPTVFKLGEIGFGDKVRIEEAEATVLSGHAGRVGECLGMTTPSVTEVEVVGDLGDDVAINVHFEAEDIPDAWFAPELLALVEHPRGSRAVVGDQAFVMDASGDWRAENDVSAEPARRGWFKRR